MAASSDRQPSVGPLRCGAWEPGMFEPSLYHRSRRLRHWLADGPPTQRRMPAAFSSTFADGPQWPLSHSLSALHFCPGSRLGAQTPATHQPPSRPMFLSSRQSESSLQRREQICSLRTWSWPSITGAVRQLRSPRQRRMVPQGLPKLAGTQIGGPNQSTHAKGIPPLSAQARSGPHRVRHNLLVVGRGLEHTSPSAQLESSRQYVPSNAPVRAQYFLPFGLSTVQ